MKTTWMLSVPIVVAVAGTAHSGVRAADGTGPVTPLPSGASSGTSGDDGWSKWVTPEPTEEEEREALEAKQAERDDWWAAHGTNDPNPWTTPPPLRSNRDDSWSSDGPLPAGTLRVAPFTGGNVPYPEVASIAVDLASHNAYMSGGWNGRGDADEEILGTTLEDDETWLNSLPWFAKVWKAAPTLEDLGNMVADAMPNDVARENMKNISFTLNQVSKLTSLAVSGRVTAADIHQVQIINFTPGASKLRGLQDTAAAVGTYTTAFGGASALPPGAVSGQ